MRFDSRYSEVTAQFAPHVFVSPAPVAVDIGVGRVIQTGRRYPCSVCGSRTGWRAEVDGGGEAPICSDECFEVFNVDIVVESTVLECKNV